MSYKTPVIPLLTNLKGIDRKVQDISLLMDASLYTSGIEWLTHAYGMSERIVEFRDGREFVYPACYQDINSKDPQSMMPNDVPDSFCFWTKEDTVFGDNPTREYHNVSCIFYMDLKQIAPTNNWKETKTQVRQDIIEFFRVNVYNGGFGVVKMTGITDDDITRVYEGYSVGQIENLWRQLPKYALKIDFEFSFIKECPVNNIYA